MSVHEIAVIGAGTMGAGIAQLAAGHGCTVRLIDVSEQVVRQALDGIARRLDQSAKKAKLTQSERDAILARIQITDTIQGLDNVELAIEAVVEDLATKQEVFAMLDAICPPSAVLATNTSSLCVTRIAEAVRNPQRVIGMHFFNPAPVMPLVEIIAAKVAAESHIDTAFMAVRQWGKVAVRAQDTPGFIVNRVARGFYLEALRLLGEGVAGVDEIDHIMRKRGKFKMGPFELLDLVGLDVNLAVTTSIWERMDKPARFAPHEILTTLVEKGHLGRKSGRGFYSYKYETPLPAHQVDRRSFELSPLLSSVMLAFAMRAGAVAATSTEQYVLCRIIGAVINEAGLAYSQGVASSRDIDIAMVKGMNHPQGPLAWADDIGHRTVRGLLKALNSTVSDGRYESAPLFSE